MKKPAYLWEATEDEIHAAIVQALRIVFPKVIVAHIPNEGKRTAGEAARQAALGLQAGMPDLLITLPEGRCGWIEVKSKYGRTSTVQNAVHDALLRLGHPICVARDVGDAISFVKRLMPAEKAA